MFFDTRPNRMESYDYESLKMFLEDAGFYEMGMTTAEMLDIQNAINQSKSDSALELQTEESSIDFLEKELLHSTIVESAGTSSSIDSAYGSNKAICDRLSSVQNSPTKGGTLSIIAVVHHELDWSPKKSNNVNVQKRLKRCSQLNLNVDDDEQVESKRRRVQIICSEDEIMNYYEYYRSD